MAISPPLRSLQPELRDLYERDFALIRPDQIVAWRGNDPAQAKMVLARVTGRERA